MGGNSKNDLESGRKGKRRALTDEEAKTVVGGIESNTPGSQPNTYDPPLDSSQDRG